MRYPRSGNVGDPPVRLRQEEIAMAVAQQRMTEQEYEAFVWAHPDAQWELHDGVLVEKPGMTWEHSDLAFHTGHLLQLQLDRKDYRVFVEGRVRRPPATVFIPDVMVLPTSYGEPFRGRPGKLAILPGPVPLVVEVWSRSTGDYDVDTKIPVYQQRGDLEIWRLHPYERTLTRWVRQPDGSYTESVHLGGAVVLAALPGVTIDLDRLFAR
jgi:Uma2 family endonuclease